VNDHRSRRKPPRATRSLFPCQRGSFNVRALAVADVRSGANPEVALGTNRGASITKRERERARQQRQREKAERRAKRSAERKEQPPRDTNVDPDIAGIVPGPQPRDPEDY
jgi:hypothetical protein